MLADNPFADLVPSNQPGVIMGPPETPKRGSLPQGWEYGADGLPHPVAGLPSGFTDPPKPKGEGGTGEAKQAEQTAAFLTTNLLTNINVMNKALKVDPSVAAPTWGQVAAGLLGQDVKNQMLPAQRQVVENSQRLIVDAALTLGTGAAYSPEQIEAYRRGFFPQVGDTPEAIAAKRESLRGALLAARIKAGGAAPQIDQAMQMLGMSSDPYTGDGTPSPPGDAPGGGTEPLQPGEFVRDGQTWYKDPKTGEETPVVIGGSVKPEVAQLAKAEGPATGFDLLKQGATLGLSDEASGVGNALYNAISSPFTDKKFDPLGSYQTGRDAERARLNDVRKQLGGTGTALEIAGGFLSANPLSGGITPATGALGTILQGARGGAAGGALAGFGYGNGVNDSLEKTIVGGVAGGALGGLVSGVSTRLGPTLPDAELASAAKAEGVRISEPMYAGNRRAINKAGMLEADASVAPIIQEGFANTASDIEAGVNKLTRGGTGQDRSGAGEMVRTAAKNIVDADKEASKAAYKAAEAIDGDPPIDLAGMRAKLDTEIERLSRTPGTNEESIRILQRYRRDIDQPLPLSAVRDMRTAIRDNVNDKGLAATGAQRRADRRMLSIIEGTNEDIQKGLSKEGWDAWHAADTQYAQQQTYVKEALRPFVGKDFDQLSGEAIFDRVKSAANSNGRALAMLHRRLGPDQSRDIAATFAENLGRRGPEDEFSTALFMSQARKLSPSARETIFGPSGSDSFNNLLRLSRRLERAKSQVNTSKTARPVMNAVRQKANQIVGALMAGGGFMTGGPVGGGAGLAAGAVMMATGAARRAMSAKALMNPRVSKWLLDGLDVSAKADMANWTNRLSTIIAREPALAGELGPIQQALTGQVNPAPLAASEPVEDNQQ